jgi:hypothetical protein
MLRLLQRLNVLAICLLGGVLASVMVAQVLPKARPLSRPGPTKDEDEWTWPTTLQVYPSHPADPVRLVRITKGGEELVPGTYRMPHIAGASSENTEAVKEWLRDVSFILKSETPKNIVSIGIAVVFPARLTDFECATTADAGGAPGKWWCGSDPHWCDGGCPELVHYPLHWGLIPAATVSGLEARYRAEARGHFDDRTLSVRGEGSLRLAPGDGITFSLAGRSDGVVAHVDPIQGIPGLMNRVVYLEGIDEARGTKPCAERIHSNTGCAFAEVPKFNIGVDIAYFEDGTIWGNHGYGYALPNSNGIFTRVSALNSLGVASAARAQN